MKFLQKIFELLNKFSRIIKIILASVLSFVFVLSITISVFIGGEFKKIDTKEYAKGILNLVSCNYLTQYISGDTFVFDKLDSKIQLMAKDPLIETVVNIDQLPVSEYGFQVNGEGKIYNNASEIVLDETVDYIDVVSIVYPNIKQKIDVTVYGEIDESKLSSSLLHEAEDANLYKSNVLLTEEDKVSKPDANKPYYSNEGTVIEGENCSGGATFRNFQADDMKIEFVIISSTFTEVDMTIDCCKRKEVAMFGNWYKVDVNGAAITELESVSMPSSSGYYEPHRLDPIKISLQPGINLISFKSGLTYGTQNPGNIDCIRLDAQDSVIGDISCVR